MYEYFILFYQNLIEIKRKFLFFNSIKYRVFKYSLLRYTVTYS